MGINVQDVTTSPARTTSVTSVASSASSVTLLTADDARRGCAVFNDSSAILYMKFGATATTSSYTIKMAAGTYYEFPLPCYQGVVDGIWASANGSARITELT